MSEYIIDWDENLVIDTFSKNSLRGEIVRCKDCRFKAWDDAGLFCRKNIFMGKFEPNGFCSWGERRSE